MSLSSLTWPVPLTRALQSLEMMVATRSASTSSLLKARTATYEPEPMSMTVDSSRSHTPSSGPPEQSKVEPDRPEGTAVATCSVPCNKKGKV